MRARGGRRIRSSYARPTALSRRSGATAFRLSIRSSTRKPMGTRPKVAATRLAWMRGCSLAKPPPNGRQQTPTEAPSLSTEHRPWPARFLQHRRDACAVRVKHHRAGLGHNGSACARTAISAPCLKLSESARRSHSQGQQRSSGRSLRGCRPMRRDRSGLLVSANRRVTSPGSRETASPRLRSPLGSGRATAAIPAESPKQDGVGSARNPEIRQCRDRFPILPRVLDRLREQKGRRPRPRPMSWR